MHHIPQSSIINSSNQQSQYCFSNFSDVEQKIKDVESDICPVLRPSETEESCVCWLLVKSQVFTLRSIRRPGQHALCRAVPRGSWAVLHFCYRAPPGAETQHWQTTNGYAVEFQSYGMNGTWIHPGERFAAP